jgi:para-nitrobenzyl esterase
MGQQMGQTMSRSIWIAGAVAIALGSFCAVKRSPGADAPPPAASIQPSLAASAIAPPLLTIATTRQGQLMGSVDGGAIAFKGIPYAAAPVGDLRWREPQPAPAWQGIRQANAFGKSCIQPTFDASINGAGSNVGAQSEDCLSLNVWTPGVNPPSNRPVMVWIHGGAYAIGSSNLPVWSGAPLANKGAVVVNLNYRLGQLGFFAHPALEKDSPSGPVNFGLLDQIAALKWVQQNIAAFGGDPNNVTIFGESAGGQSVLALMASPLAKGLFQKGIAQSTYGSPEVTRSRAVEIGGKVAAAVGLRGAASTSGDLRAVPAEKFGQLKSLGLSTSPVAISGDPVLPKPILSTFENGEEARVPLIVGSNSNEASVATAFGMEPAALVQRLGAFRSAIEVLYPEVNDDKTLGLQLIRDSVFTAPGRQFAALHARYAPTWRYYFSYVPAGLRSQWADGVPHGGEIAFVMNTVNLDQAIAGKLTNADRAMASRVSQYWFEFARTGTPQSANSPVWPTYSLSSDKTLAFGERITVELNFMKARLDVLSKLYAQIFPSP